MEPDTSHVYLSIYLYILHHTSRECYVQRARQCILKSCAEKIVLNLKC